MAKKLFVKSDSRALTEIMDANAEVAFIDEIGGFEGIRAGGHTYQTIPDGGTNGQVLTKQDGVAVWKDTTDTLDLLTYGIKWSAYGGNPTPITRIGNMEMHKTLPIQSGMRGCILDSKTGQVNYWLDNDDWRFRATPVLCSIYTDSGSIDPSEFKVDTDNNYLVGIQLKLPDAKDYLDLKEGQYIRIPGSDVRGEVIFSEDWSDKVIHLINIPVSTFLSDFAGNIESELTFIELGSVLDGSEGEVMVYVPEFYIKSGYNSTERWVRISPTKIDNSWEHQPAVFVGAYRDSRYPTISGDPMSGLFVSACNKKLKGGDMDDPSYEGNSDIFKNTLGKPSSNITRNAIRESVSGGGRVKRHILSYRQYKNILYWLPVIEYATFNLQQNFTDILTSTGFHKGGLGKGITNVTNWESYSNFSPICPNGYTNDLGNNSGESQIHPGGPAPVGQVYANRYRGIENPYGDLYTIVDGILIDRGNIGATESAKYGAVHTTDNPTYYLDYISSEAISSMSLIYYIPKPLGHISDWKVGSTAEMLPAKSVENSSGTIGVSSNYIGSGAARCKAVALGGCADSGTGGGPGLFSVDFEPTTGRSNAAGWRAVVMP